MLDELIEQYYGGYSLAKKLDKDKSMEEFNVMVENYINQFKEKLYEEVSQQLCKELKANFEYSNPNYYSHYLVRFTYYGVELVLQASGDNWNLHNSYNKTNEIIKKGDLLASLCIELGKIKEKLQDFIVEVSVIVSVKSVTKDCAITEAIELVRATTPYQVSEETTYGI